MPSLSSILISLTVALGLFGWGMYERSEAIKYEASAATLRAANDANLATIDRLQVDVVIAQAAAIADAQEKRKLETDHDELLAAAREAKGDCNGLDAILERRRLQLERDRDGDKANRP